MSSRMKTYTNKVKELVNKGIIHVFVGSFLTKFVGMFGSVILVRLLTKSQYGTLSYIENLFSYFYIFIGFGLAEGLSRYVVINEDSSKKSGTFFYTFKRGTVNNIILLIIASAFLLIYVHPTLYQDTSMYILVLVFSTVFHFFIVLSLNLTRALFNHKLYAILTFSTSLGILVFRILGAFFAELDGVIFGRLIGEIILSIFVLLLIRIIYRKSLFSKTVTYSKNEKNEIKKYSYTNMIVSAVWIIFMLNDTFLLGIFGTSPSELADYKIAYVIPGSFLIISNSVIAFALPYFTYKDHKGEFKWIKKNLAILSLFTTITIAFGSLIVYIFSRPIISLVFGEIYLTAIPILEVLLLGTIINSGIRFPFASLLAGMGKIKYNLIISIIGTLLQISINIIIIPKFGTVGVAYTSLLIYSLMSIALVYLTYYVYYKDSNLKNNFESSDV